jgi:hypothetical protein
MSKQPFYLDGEQIRDSLPIVIYSNNSDQKMLSVDHTLVRNGWYVSKKINFNSHLISSKFSKLKSEKNVLDFSNEYGLLGLDSTRNLQHFNVYLNDHKDPSYFRNFKYSDKSVYESLEEWKWHINRVTKQLKLIRSIQQNDPVQDLISIEEEEGGHRIFLCGEEPTKVFYTPEDFTRLKRFDKLDMFKNIAIEVIYSDMRHFLSIGGKETLYIDLFDYHQHETNQIGFRFEDRKATSYLLCAIYYDVFRQMNMREVIRFCKFCNRPFEGRRSDAFYCSKSCKTGALRKFSKGAKQNE